MLNIEKIEVLLLVAVAIYPAWLVFIRSKLRVTLRHQHILFWGGLRGALALALALGLPPEIAERQGIIAVSFAMVAFSILVQGLTITPLMLRGFAQKGRVAQKGSWLHKKSNCCCPPRACL